MRIAALGFACLLAFGAFLQGGAALAQDRAGWPTELAFGVIPNEGSVDLTQRFQPLFTHLQRSLKLPVKPLIAPLSVRPVALLTVIAGLALVSTRPALMVVAPAPELVRASPKTRNWLRLVSKVTVTALRCC